jgi:uncharacterized protein (TIRG00374 family)
MLRRSRYLGFVITGAFIALLAWKIDLHELEVALVRANYLFIGPIVGCICASYLLRTLRWKRILGPVRTLSFRTLVSVVFIGFMANNLLPARMGELVRAYALGQKTGLSKSLGLATILVERLCDGLTLVLVLGVIALAMPLPPLVREVGIVASLVFFAVGAGIVLVLAGGDRVRCLLVRASQSLPERLSRPIERKADAFVAGLRTVQGGRQLAVIAGWSILVWSVEATTYLLVLRSFGPPRLHGPPVLAALLMMAMVNLGTLIPSAPGYVGAYQFFGVLALGAVGVPGGVALAIAIVAHAAQWVTVTVIGLLCMARESMTVSVAPDGVMADIPSGSAGRWR